MFRGAFIGHLPVWWLTPCFSAILEPHAQASLGGLFLVPVTPEQKELTFESFGIDHLLLYVPKVNYDEFVADIGYAR